MTLVELVGGREAGNAAADDYCVVGHVSLMSVARERESPRDRSSSWHGLSLPCTTEHTERTECTTFEPFRFCVAQHAIRKRSGFSAGLGDLGG